MSYDFWVEIDTGGAEPARLEPFFDDELAALSGHELGGMTAVVTPAGYGRCGNYTSNVSGMWARCLTGALDHVELAAATEYRSWCGSDDRRLIERTGRRRHVETERLRLLDLVDRPCEQLVPLLRQAVLWGVAHIDELRAENPSNGWGDAEGAVTYLWDIQRMCEAHPQGRLRIWA